MNGQLIETIEKALEAATQGKWVDCSWDVMERPHVFAKELQTGHYCNGKADLPQTSADCHLIANAPEWLRALLEENKRLQELLELWKGRYIAENEKLLAEIYKGDPQ